MKGKGKDRQTPPQRRTGCTVKERRAQHAIKNLRQLRRRCLLAKTTHESPQSTTNAKWKLFTLASNRYGVFSQRLFFRERLYRTPPPPLFHNRGEPFPFFRLQLLLGMMAEMNHSFVTNHKSCYTFLLFGGGKKHGDGSFPFLSFPFLSFPFRITWVWVLGLGF